MNRKKAAAAKPEIFPLKKKQTGYDIVRKIDKTKEMPYVGKHCGCIYCMI